MTGWYYYFDGGRTVGPLEQSDVLVRIAQGKIGPYQMIYRDGQSEWRPALAFAEFREALSAGKSVSQSEQQWIILKKNEDGQMGVESVGPLASEEVLARVRNGSIEYTDYAWKDGMHQWRRIGTIKEFSPEVFPMPQIYKVEGKVEDKVKLPAPSGDRDDLLKSVEVVKNRFDITPEVNDKPKEAAGENLAQSSFEKLRQLMRQPIEKAPVPEEVEVPPEITVVGITLNPKTTPKTASGRSELPPLPRSPHSSKLPNPKRPAINVTDESSVTNASSQLENQLSNSSTTRFKLPSNWWQVALGIFLVVAVSMKYYNTRSKLISAEIVKKVLPEAPVAPIPSVEPEVFIPEQQVVVAGNAEAKPAAPPAESESESGSESINESPSESAPLPKPKTKKHKSHSATYLQVKVDRKKGELAAISIETDASSDQVIWIELISSPGQLVNATHFFKRWKWNSGKPLSLDGGEIPHGRYRIRVTAGMLVSEEKFEIGTHEKSFAEKLKLSRKHAYVETWSERKRLMRYGHVLEKAIASGNSGNSGNSGKIKIPDLDKLAKAGAEQFIFHDLWSDLFAIYLFAKTSPAAQSKARVQEFLAKIASLTIWKG